MPSGAVPSEVPAGTPTELEAVRAALARWGCAPYQVLEVRARWYAACGEAGVFVLERDEDKLLLRERRQTQGQARGLFTRESTIWVESAITEARPLAELASATPTGDRAVVSSVPVVGALPASIEGPAPPSKIAPPRVPSVWSFEGALRPYLPLDSLAFAALIDATVTYRGERAWYAFAQLKPFGGVVGSGTDAGLFGAFAGGGYDHQYFSIGLGLGALRRGQSDFVFDDVSGQGREFGEHSTSLAVGQYARLGALDGLSMSVANVFVLDDERWEFGYFDLGFQIPVNRQTWIMLQGGGAEQAGYFYAEVGLRRLVFGTRESGSFFVKPSAGVAGIDNRVNSFQPGPMVGIHLEYRL